MDLRQILGRLAEERPVFHSEADFQHALAWAIHDAWPEWDIRLERRVPGLDENLYVDICAFGEHQEVWIELKYKTRKLSVTVNGEAFSLKDQSAQDLGRYDFVHDISRLERIVHERGSARTIGLAVLLTNDSAYWKPPGRTRTIDADFRLHSGHTLMGALRWRARGSSGTAAHRPGRTQLGGCYRPDWQDYSELAGQLSNAHSYTTFRYLAITVAHDHR